MLERWRFAVAGLFDHGVAGAALTVQRRIFGHRSPFFHANKELFRGRGLEVGGPSALFGKRGFTPVYSYAAALDNVNYAAATRWEGSIASGETFHFRESATPGRQFIHEAAALDSVPDGSYDFVVSCHMLEHSANPLKVLHEWKRVVQPGGTLLLVLPHKEGTFDRHRPTTSLEHMEEDYRRDVGEDDATHIPEVLALHDLTRDRFQESSESFRKWVEGNAVNRGVHHHVFDSLTAARLVDRARFAILQVEPDAMDSIYVFARRPLAGEVPENREFTQPNAAYLRASPFLEDRRLATR